MPVTLIRQVQLRDVGGLTREQISMTNHGFSAGQALYWNGSSWVLARADNITTAEVLGIVESTETDKFTIVYQGKITGLSGLTPGSVYYLSSTVAGALTTVVPGADVVSKPLLVARTTTDGIVVNWRGMIGVGDGGGSPAEVAEIYSTTIGDGSSTSFVITPGMDTSKVLVQLSEASTGKIVGGPEEITIGYNSNTQVKIDFPSNDPPSTDQYKVVVVGIG